MVLNYLQFFSDFTTSLSSEEPKATSVVEEKASTNTEKTPPEEINKEFRSVVEETSKASTNTAPEEINKEFRSAEEVPEDIKTPEDINTEYRSNQLDGIENLQRQGN